MALLRNRSLPEGTTERKETPPAAAEALTSTSRPWWIGLPGLSDGITTKEAVGLPALLGVLRLFTGGAMMMPLVVFEDGPDAGHLRQAPETWQWDLLHRYPLGPAIANGGGAWRADCFGSLAARGELLLRKLKEPDGTVFELPVLNPDNVRIERRGGRVVFRDSTNGETVDRYEDEIIFIRTFAHAGELRGVSPITAAREAFEAAIKRQKFELNYYKHDARPGVVIQFPENIPKDIAEEWLTLWNQDHEGVEAAWRASVLGGGSELKTIPVSAKDAMFVEMLQMTSTQIASLYQIPLSFYVSGGTGITETDRSLLLTFGFGPFMSALTEGISNDRDLFNVKRDGRTLSVDLLDGELLKPDMTARYAAYLKARQGGWIKANEIRANEGFPPVEGGDQIQLTPVGGAPNPTGSGGGDGLAADEKQLMRLVRVLVKALKFNEDQPRDESGRFAGEGGGGGGGGSGGGNVKPITAAEARGDSRAVSEEEFQRIASDGEARLAELQANASPITGLDENWDQLKTDTFAASQQSWGGATIDAHTGAPIDSGYALTVKTDGVSTVSVPEDASAAEFNDAMDQARESFRPTLENERHCLGVFHDDELHRIDIDPVLVVDSLDDVEKIGAATHAIGGAYSFADGNGYWPPHVGEAVGATKAAAHRAFAGIGQWWHQAR